MQERQLIYRGLIWTLTRTPTGYGAASSLMSLGQVQVSSWSLQVDAVTVSYRGDRRAHTVFRQAVPPGDDLEALALQYGAGLVQAIVDRGGAISVGWPSMTAVSADNAPWEIHAIVDNAAYEAALASYLAAI